MSTNAEQWVALRKRLSAVPVIAGTEPLRVDSDGSKELSAEEFGALDAKRVARFFVDVSDGDWKKATDLVRRFSRKTTDRIFARAVAVAVERSLARAEME
jgi:hypothetical protein